jgi:hypothetical protein
MVPPPTTLPGLRSSGDDSCHDEDLKDATCNVVEE